MAGRWRPARRPLTWQVPAVWMRHCALQKGPDGYNGDWNIVRNHKQAQGKAVKGVQESQKKLHEEELKDLGRHPGERSGGTTPLSSNIQSATGAGRSGEFWEAPKDRMWTRKQKLQQSECWLQVRKTSLFNHQGHPRMGLGALEGQELPVKGGNQDEGQLPLNCRGGPGTSRGVGRGEPFSVLRFCDYRYSQTLLEWKIRPCC